MSEEELSLIKAYLKENGRKKRLHPIPEKDIITLNGIPCPLYDKKNKVAQSTLFDHRYATTSQENI